MTATVAVAAHPTRWQVGAADDISPRPLPGLLLMGGGGDVDAAMQWWLEKAAGGDVVVLRASGGDGYNDYFFRELGVALNSVTTLRFDSREEALDPSAAITIRQAEALFLAGGDQSRYLRFWPGTPVGEAIADHLTAGKPTGGTSAGLAVLGEFAYGAMHDGDLTSLIALRDPFDPLITVESGFFAAPAMRGVLTDSHFTERRRLGRLIVMLGRLQAERGRPDLLGVGIDERTALAVDGEGDARVFTADNGTVTLVSLPETVPLSPGTPAGPGVAQIVLLDRSSRFSFRERSADRPANVTTVKFADGRLHADE